MDFFKSTRLSNASYTIIAMFMIIVALTFLGFSEAESNQIAEELISQFEQQDKSQGDSQETNSKGDLDPDVIGLDDNTSWIVSRVVDGDTLELKPVLNSNVDNNIELKVRLIGVDTPETVAPNTPVECFGPEATEFVRDFVEDREFLLTTDNSQDLTDRFGRYLVYLDLVDSTDSLNSELISNGYGREYTYDNAYERQSEFQALEISAQSNQAGLWGVCN